MPRFSFEKNLPSLRVDRDLISRIEDYAKSELVRLAALPPEHRAKSFSVSITDALGTETLNSIGEYRPAQLPDSTATVSLHFDSSYYGKSAIELGLTFARNRDYSRLSLKANTEADAREIVVSVHEGVMRILEPHRTSHRLFHPPPGVGGALGLIVWLSAIATPWTIERFPTFGILLGLVVIVYVAYRYAGKSLKPWTTFDSRLDRQNAEIWRWFKFGVLTFMVFGTAFAFLRRRFLGF